MPLPPTSACRPALLSLLLLAALSGAGTAFAQAARPSPQAECTATNREKHAELLAELDAARKRNVTNPVLVSRLQTFELQQARLREALRRNARSEAECDQIGSQIEAEAERLAKLLGNEGAPASTAAAASAPAPAARALAAPAPPPPPAPPPADLTCLNGVAQDFNGVVQSLGEARREAKAPESELEPLAQRLNSLRERTAAAMQSPQPTREQCDALARELTAERDTLQRLVAGTRRAPVPAPVVLAVVPPPVVVTSPAAPQPQPQPQIQPSSPPPAPAHRSSLAPEPTPEQAAATMRTATVESSRPPDPRARACSGELRLSFRDVEQAITSLATDGGSVAQQGKQMARRLLQMLLVQQVVIFSREFLSLEDCQQLSQTIADLRSQAQQLRATYAEARGQAQQQQQQQQAFAPQSPRSDPRLDECRGHVRRGQSDLQQQFQGQQRTGRVSPQEFGEYQNIAGRLNQMMQAVFRDGASYADCQQTASFIGQAQGAVQRMAQVDPRIESCKAQVRQIHNDAQQQLQFAARSGRMTPQKAQALQMAQGRLSNLGSMAQRDFGSLMECQNVGNALQQERGNIQGLAR